MQSKKEAGKMKISEVKRLAISLYYVGKEAEKIQELYEKVKLQNPRVTHKEIYQAGLTQFIKKS